MKHVGAFLILVAMASSAMAVDVVTPEIDGNTAATAVVLVSGGLLILRGRRKK